MITDAKENCFSTLDRKLTDPAFGLKTYLTTLNRIINQREKTNIPPILENEIFVTHDRILAPILVLGSLL